MIRYAKLINEETGLCSIGTGTNIEFYKSIGMVELDVQQSDIDNAWYLAKKCPMKTDEQKAKEKRERLDKLSMTRGDVFEALILARGLTKPQIRAMIENAELDDITKALYLNRFDEALDFYRGFPVFDMLGQVLGVTPKQLDDFFETKDYHYLTNITLKINATPSEAIVTINGKTTKEFSTPYQPNLQLPITYSVACEGYTTKEDEIVLSENTVLEVVLEEEQPTEPAEVETSVVEESSESV